MNYLLQNAPAKLLSNSLHRAIPILLRSCAHHQSDKTVTEDEIKTILKKRFATSQNISVQDVSGGCGAMFNIYVESSDFKGLSVVKQHKIVYDTLQEQIKNIHGLHLENQSLVEL